MTAPNWPRPPVARHLILLYPATMNRKQRAKLIAARLRAYYRPIAVQRRDPVEELVLTILSQNTNDTNRDRAYASLMKRFGTLTAVMDATADEIATAIRIGGLHRQKGARIKHVLERIFSERGTLDISFLADVPLADALTWLLSFPGVGNKTAGIVLLFSFGKPYFPVDTHIKRVTRRLGLVSSTEDPHIRMNAILPKSAEFMIQLHLGLIRLGRDICHPRRPECAICPLADLCPTSCQQPDKRGQ